MLFTGAIIHVMYVGIININVNINNKSHNYNYYNYSKHGDWNQEVCTIVLKLAIAECR